jgi:hypothetical protein
MCVAVGERQRADALRMPDRENLGNSSAAVVADEIYLVQL